MNFVISKLKMQNNFWLLASSCTVVNILKEFYILQTKKLLNIIYL